MAWIILEGLDRTGKSSVAAYYEKQGYRVVHLSAPDKKYFKTGYTGPSYLDELLELYMSCDDQDVVFDRSPYGELVWPFIYNREPLLSEADLDPLEDFENKNEVQKFLMVDPNTEEHWKRCVDNQEPLTRNQFILAGRLFNQLAHKQGFFPRKLDDFGAIPTDKENEGASSIEESKVGKAEPSGEDKTPSVSSPDPVNNRSQEDIVSSEEKNQQEKTKEQQILEKANAINSVLSKRIIRQKGSVFDQIENDIKNYLNDQISVLFNGGTNLKDSFTENELTVLKMYAQKILEKQKERT